MKVVEVGRFRVGYDDLGEGATLINHPRSPRSATRTMVLKPGELQDLLVALDVVQGHTKPCSRTDLPAKIVETLRAASHALYVLGLRHRLELHVDTHVLHDLAHAVGGKEPTRWRHDTYHLDLGGFRLVARRGVHP